VELVERLRQGDTIDFSLGILTFGLDRSVVKALRNPFPSEDFHWTLIKIWANWLTNLENWRNPTPFLRF